MELGTFLFVPSELTAALRSVSLDQNGSGGKCGQARLQNINYPMRDGVVREFCCGVTTSPARFCSVFFVVGFIPRGVEWEMPFFDVRGLVSHVSAAEFFGAPPRLFGAQNRENPPLVQPAHEQGRPQPPALRTFG